MNGIDYGMGQTNIDHNTGIRYGVISAHDLGEGFWDEAEADYGKPSCPECGELLDLSTCECDNCDKVWEEEECWPEQPIAWYIDDEDGTKAEHTGDSDSDFFVTASLYYTRAAFCSPCAPGACSLETPYEGGDKAYCFGHSWFDSGKAPYPVYRVSDNSLVEPN